MQLEFEGVLYRIAFHHPVPTDHFRDRNIPAPLKRRIFDLLTAGRPISGIETSRPH